MPNIELRLQLGARSPGDLVLSVQDKTFDYLMSSAATEIRVSAYLDRDWPNVEAEYAEVFVHETCAYESKVTKVLPGSKFRPKVPLPGPMEEGEQLTLLVKRKSLNASEDEVSEEPQAI